MKLENIKLNFGIKALEWLNDHYKKIELEDGLEIGGAIIKVSIDKTVGDLGTLVKLIHAGTLTDKKVLSIEDIENELEKMEFEDIQELYNEVFTKFKNSPAVMYQANKMKWMDLMEEATKA